MDLGHIYRKYWSNIQSYHINAINQLYTGFLRVAGKATIDDELTVNDVKVINKMEADDLECTNLVVNNVITTEEMTCNTDLGVTGNVSVTGNLTVDGTSTVKLPIGVYSGQGTTNFAPSGVCNFWGTFEYIGPGFDLTVDKVNARLTNDTAQTSVYTVSCYFQWPSGTGWRDVIIRTNNTEWYANSGTLSRDVRAVFTPLSHSQVCSATVTLRPLDYIDFFANQTAGGTVACTIVVHMQKIF